MAPTNRRDRWTSDNESLGSTEKFGWNREIKFDIFQIKTSSQCIDFIIDGLGRGFLMSFNSYFIINNQTRK